MSGLSDKKVDELLNKGFDLEMFNRYESAIYLLQNLSNTLRLEFDENLKKFGIRGKTSELSFKADNATQAYLQQVRGVIKGDQNLLFLDDYEKFDAYFRKLVGLPQ